MACGGVAVSSLSTVLSTEIAGVIINPDPARPYDSPPVEIAAVAELLGAPAFFAGIAPGRSGNLSAPPMAISSTSDLKKPSCPR
jgi:hypothetical protein